MLYKRLEEYIDGPSEVETQPSRGIKVCPNCGSRNLSDGSIDTYPPILTTVCLDCGWTPGSTIYIRAEEEDQNDTH